MWIIIRGLCILAAIAAVVILFLATGWILGMLGINPPERLMTAIFVFIGLVATIYALTGGFERLWKCGPPPG
jgi:hypothetical protein